MKSRSWRAINFKRAAYCLWDEGPVHIWPITCFNWQSWWPALRLWSFRPELEYELWPGWLHRSLALITVDDQEADSFSWNPAAVHPVLPRGRRQQLNFTERKKQQILLDKIIWHFLSSSLVKICQRTFLVFLVLTNYLLVNFRCYTYVSCTVFIKKKKIDQNILRHFAVNLLNPLV